MIKLINKKRKITAIILAIASTLIALPFILGENADAAIFASVTLAMALSVSVALFAKGLSVAVMVLTYAFIILSGIVVGVILQLFIRLPENINSQIFSSLTIGVTLFLIMGIRLPAKAGAKIKKQLQSEDPANGEQPKQTKTLATYQDYVTQKGANRYHARPYSMENISPIQQKIRLAVGIPLIAIAIIGLLIVGGIEDTVTDLANSYIFWGGMASILALLLGFFVLIVGFIRTSIATVSIVSTITFGVWLGYKLTDTYYQSLLHFTAALCLIIFLIVYISIIIYKIHRKRVAAFPFTFYEKNEYGITVDLALKELLPIDGYTKSIRCIASFTPKEGLDAINEIAARIIAYANRKKLIFTGFTFEFSDSEAMIYSFYIYSNHDCSKALKKILSKFNYKSLAAGYRKDSEWSVYSKKLYPDLYTYHTIGNQNMYAFLEQKGYDFSKPISLIYTLIFEFEQDALQCTEAVPQSIYIRAQYKPNADYVAENGLSEKFSYIVFIQNECRAGLEQLNAQTRKIMDFAEHFRGELYDFDMGELADTEDHM